MKPKGIKAKKLKKAGTVRSALPSVDKSISSMSVDDFFETGLDSDEETDENGTGIEQDTILPAPVSQPGELDDDDDEDDQEDDESTSDEEGNEEDFKKSLSKLKESDPSFYKFLQENEQDGLQMEDEEEEEQMQNASDGSDDEEDDDENLTDSSGLSLTQIALWEAALASNQPKAALQAVTQALRAAVQRVNAAGDGPNATIEDPTVFNALVALCLNGIPPAVASILKLESADKDPTKSKRWVQVKGTTKRYLTDVIQLLASAGSAGMQRALLRHLLAMTPYLAAEARLCSSIVSRLVALWSTGEEEVRVLAFVNLYRLARRNQAALLDTVLMKAYLAYVKNCAFTSPTTWPLIHLMRRSLVELYSIDPAASYQRAFLYIRQLAIHLRNAKLDKKKFQVVYNWQFVHCLLLWSALVGEDRSEDLRLLLYPLTQIMLGAVNLVTTSRHYPLRFHITRALTQLSANTGTFIPVLPLLLQVLHQTDFNKRNTRVSMRPLELSCMLRFSESELKENGFRDGVFEAVLDGLTEYLHVECCSLAFPELVVMARLQLKDFLSTCKVRTYNQRIKELLDKMKANCEHLEQRRQNLAFELSDLEAVRRWEQEQRAEGTPLTAYHQSWLSRRQQEREAKPGKDNKISLRTPAPEDSDSEAEGGSDDELQTYHESDEEPEEEEADQAPGLDSESDEVEDDGDTLAPMKPAKRKQQKPPPQSKSPGGKRRRGQNRPGKVARVR